MGRLFLVRISERFSGRCKTLANTCFQVFQLVGFFDDRPLAVSGWNAARTKTAGENERNAARQNRVRDRIDLGTGKIDVENSQIEVGAGCQFKGLGQKARIRRRLGTKRVDHILQYHQDERLILHQKNVQACNRILQGIPQ